MRSRSSHDPNWNDTGARWTVVLALLATVGFGMVLFEVDFGRVHPAVHMGFFAGLCVFLAALTALLAHGALVDLEQGANDEHGQREGGIDRPQV